MSVTNITQANIQTAVNLWCSNPATATSIYGPIDGWQTNNVTNMSNLFKNKSTFNGDISRWDTSHVINMSSMFNGALVFNQDISGWDVSQVKDMIQMFQYAYAFNANISRWDTTNVVTMHNGFQFANAFVQDISLWSVPLIIYTPAYFNSPTLTKLPGWGRFVPQQKNIRYAVNLWCSDPVKATSTYGLISNWNMLLVTDMSNLFLDKTSFNADISGWNTSNVTNMDNMFKGANSFFRDLKSWSVPLIPTRPVDFCPTVNSYYSPVWGTTGSSNVVSTSIIGFQVSFPSSSTSIINKSNVVTISVMPVSVVSWEYSVNGGTTWTTRSKTITSFVLDDNTYPANFIQVRSADVSLKSCLIKSNSDIIIIDVTGPYGLAVAFPPINRPTRSSVFKISHLPPDAVSWEYSYNNGNDWIVSTVLTSPEFAVPFGVELLANSIQVRCHDASGNRSAVVSNPATILFYVLTSPLKVTYPLTCYRNVDLSILPFESASWKYSLNSGSTWTTQTNQNAPSFVLADGSYPINSVQVVCVDVSGSNIGEVVNNTSILTVDATGPTGLSITFPPSPSRTRTFYPTFPLDTWIWQLSLDGGISWGVYNISLTNNIYNLAVKTYAINAIQVKCTDLVGNYGATFTNTSVYVIDYTSPVGLAVTFPTSPSNVVLVSPTFPSDASGGWQYSLDSGASWTTVVRSISTFTLPERTYEINTIQVKCSDLAGNYSLTVANTSKLVIDITAPSGFEVRFPTYSPSNLSLITPVFPTDASGGWRYSLNSGTSWIDVSFSSKTFTIPDGTYAIDAIQVKCSDLTGNYSVPVANTSILVIDTTAPTGLDGNFPDGLINMGVISPTFPSDASGVWHYSLNSGTSWIDMSFSSKTFTLPDGTYAINAIQVKCSDLAGNYSLIVPNTYKIIKNHHIKIPADPSRPIEMTSLSLTDESIGSTVGEQKEFTSTVIKSLFGTNNTNRQITLAKGSILPGFSSSLRNTLYIFNAGTTSTLTKDDLIDKNFYVLLENGDTITMQTNNYSLQITRDIVTSVFTITKVTGPSGSTTAVSGDYYSYDGLQIILGSIYGTLLSPPINFVLSALNSEIILNTSARIPVYAPTIISDATITLSSIVSAATLQQTFFFRTDEDIAIDASFVYYYVDSSKWPTVISDLNPKMES